MSLDTSVDPISIGVPAVIPISFAKQHPLCNATQATFAGIEGNMAVYRGVCVDRHAYEERIQIKEQELEAIKALTIVNGEMQYGESGYDASSLGEF